MEYSPVELRYYQAASGACPFRDWLLSLDAAAQVLVDARLARFRRGLFGDHKGLGGGVMEARLHAGPGYRLYYGRDGNKLVILLQAGDKSGQRRDIEMAQAYWADYLRRKKL
jgi:putative addiction module killer protein